jgi:dihydroxyacetone kinase
MVAITDDIASGTADERQLRRGIAGSLLVIKMAGAAAESGMTLDEVERIAVAANDATRSFGVAFSGCTLPGSAGPLFDVPAGKMAVGLGIHGEPGIDETPLGTASEVADVLVNGLFAERPPERGRAVALLVNGLGATKYDELHLVSRQVRARLAAEQVTVIAPLAGEYVTSLDMAGVSVSLAYLDDELESLWLSPVDSPALTRGRMPALPAEARARSARVPDNTAAGEPRPEVTPGSEVSARAAAYVLAALESATMVPGWSTASGPRSNRLVRRSGKAPVPGPPCAPPESNGRTKLAARPVRCGARAWRPRVMSSGTPTNRSPRPSSPQWAPSRTRLRGGEARWWARRRWSMPSCPSPRN